MKLGSSHFCFAGGPQLSKAVEIKALLGMLARLPWGRRDMLGSMNGKYEGVFVKYASLIVSCHWIKILITA